MPIILPYKSGSASAKALANSLGCRRIALSRSNVHLSVGKQIINWGNSGNNLPPQGLGNNTIINSVGPVANASCKLRTLEILQGQGVCIPTFSTSRQNVIQWLSEGKKVVERHVLNGNSGNGIRIVESEDDLQQCRLYTQYVPRTVEYRVHVARKGDEEMVFDVQRKARNRNVPDDQVNWQVRNLEGGFIFAREGVDRRTVNTEVLSQAMKAVKALGLDFGAVDIIWNQSRNRAYVLEVNTAPGLEGTTLERYTNAMNWLLGVGPRCDWCAQSESAPQGNISETTELSEEPVVQSIQGQENTQADTTPMRSSVYAVFFESTVLIEPGIFNTKQQADGYIQSSPLCRNLAQAGSVEARSMSFTQ